MPFFLLYIRKATMTQEKFSVKRFTQFEDPAEYLSQQNKPLDKKLWADLTVK